MGIRRCSAEDALQEIAQAVHTTGIGIGGVSRALLDTVAGPAEPGAGPAHAHWATVLALPAREAPP
ncbi:MULTISPECIES: transcription antitermination regulator [unclassified Mycobacterium]|uniref:transcription antitermination regulator n=1 Tax=unclassified Mycobacterium TaxID=2642494 RepID=UPI001E47C4E1|nr:MULTISPECIES: transcription antitermination regulator [unclassified Mycobacterium]